MKTGWRYVVDESVLEFVSGPSLTAGARRKLKDVLRQLAEHPTQPATLLGFDGAGRPLSVVSEDEFEVVFWIDHAAKEVRIASIFPD